MRGPAGELLVAIHPCTHAPSAPHHTALLLVQTAPDPVLLVGREGEAPALGTHRTMCADRLRLGRGSQSFLAATHRKEDPRVCLGTSCPEVPAGSLRLVAVPCIGQTTTVRGSTHPSPHFVAEQPAGAPDGHWGVAKRSFGHGEGGAVVPRRPRQRWCCSAPPATGTSRWPSLQERATTSIPAARSRPTTTEQPRGSEVVPLLTHHRNGRDGRIVGDLRPPWAELFTAPWTRSAASRGSSCSQTRTTTQPAASSSSSVARSLATLASSFAAHQARLLVGAVECSGQRCQKQPST